MSDARIAPLVLFRTLAVNERVFLRLMAGGLLDRGSIPLRDGRSSSTARALRLGVRVGRAHGVLRRARRLHA